MMEIMCMRLECSMKPHSFTREKLFCRGTEAKQILATSDCYKSPADYFQSSKLFGLAVGGCLQCNF